LAREPRAGPVLRSYLAFLYLLADRKALVIDFRYHLVSIVAVFLALAIGIVLGSTELQGPAFSLLDKTTSKLQNELGQVSSQRDTAQQQATEGEMYAQAVEPAVLHNLLTGHRLLIVTEPGAQSSGVSGRDARRQPGHQHRRVDDAAGLRRVPVPQHQRPAGHAGQPGRRGDPADRAVRRQRGPARPGPRPGGPGAGG